MCAATFMSEMMEGGERTAPGFHELVKRGTFMIISVVPAGTGTPATSVDRRARRNVTFVGLSSRSVSSTNGITSVRSSRKRVCSSGRVASRWSNDAIMTLAREFLHVAPGGAVLDSIAIDDRLAIACALGGPDGRMLFLLTALEHAPDALRGTRDATIHVVGVDVPGAGSP